MQPSLDSDQPASCDWSVAVIARNEQAGIASCLRGIARTSAGRRVHVSVLLNGTTDNSAEAAAAAAEQAGLTASIFAIGFADKSNALNQFIHAVRPAANVYFFIDAYAVVSPTALVDLARALDREPQANATAAIPSTGRSAAALGAQMIEEHGLHGSLFALRRAFVDRLVAAGLCIPVGLYRGDGLIRSMLMHDLDAIGQPWTPARVAVVPGATWETAGLSPYRLRNAKRLWSRAIRQRQGMLESAAIKARIYAGGFGSLAAFSGPMIREWVAEHPEARWPSAWCDPFAALAFRRLTRARLPTEAELAPMLVAQILPGRHEPPCSRPAHAQ